MKKSYYLVYKIADFSKGIHADNIKCTVYSEEVDRMRESLRGIIMASSYTVCVHINSHSAVMFGAPEFSNDELLVLPYSLNGKRYLKPIPINAHPLMQWVEEENINLSNMTPDQFVTFSLF